MNRLDARIGALVAQKTLTRAQGDELLQAGEADLADALAQDGDVRTTGPSRHRGAVLEVLGYVGAALLLGAVGFTAFLFWDDMSSMVRDLLALACVLVPGIAGAVLIATRWRDHLGQILVAAGVCASTFTWYVLAPDVHYAPYLTMLIGGAVGVIALRHWSFLVPAGSGGIGVVFEFSYRQVDTSAVDVALGLGLVAVGLALAGWLVNSSVSWSFAGLTGWSAAAYLSELPHGEWLVLAGITLVAAGLFLGFVRRGTHATAVIGSLMVLIMWPFCLGEIFDGSLGVAVGLVAAGSALIATVVVLSRRKVPPAPETT